MPCRLTMICAERPSELLGHFDGEFNVLEMMLGDGFSAVQQFGDQDRAALVIEAEARRNFSDGREGAVAGSELVAFRLGPQRADGFRIPLADLLHKIALPSALGDPEIAIPPR